MPAFTRQELDDAQEAFEEVAARLAPPEDAWKAEQQGLAALPMLIHPEAPREFTSRYVEAVAARGDETAAAALTAMARLAHPPLRDDAREAVAKLARDGVRSPLEDDIGTLRVQGCAGYELDGVLAAVNCLLQRPSTPGHAQAVAIFIDPDGGGVVEVQSGDPEPVKDVTRAFKKRIPSGRRREMSPEEVIELLADGLEAGEPLLDEMLFDLAILERALTGEEMRLPRPPVYPYEDAEEEEGFAGHLVDQMVAEGVDPSDPAALQAWMDDFNSRPYEERRAITDGEGAPAARRSPPRKQKQRRAAKTARKRNRRR